MIDEVRVLIADDQKVVRDGLAMLLELLGGVTVVGTAVDGADALRQIAKLEPDVVLMDLIMPQVDGVTATRVVVANHPGTRVVVLTTYADDKSVFAALEAGARGYLTKDASAEEIRDAIETVAAGDAQLDPSIQRRLLEALAAGAHTAVAEPEETGPPNDGLLTAREADVLVEIAGGLSNGEIAKHLVVSEATVKTHVNHLLAKTKCRDRAQLVSWAYRNKYAKS